LTVFFDPGRVKRGVGPNVTLGRAIVQGRRYAIAVDAGWPDANGQTLAAGFRREFTAGPAAYEALRTADWRVEAPAAGSRAAVVVTFPAPLDRPLLERAIGVRRAPGGELAGQIVVGSGDTTWRFTPAAAWLAGPYDLAVLTLLEDPAGNRIGRAFEVLTTDTPPQSTDADVTRVRFNIK